MLDSDSGWSTINRNLCFLSQRKKKCPLAISEACQSHLVAACSSLTQYVPCLTITSDWATLM